MNLRPGPPTKCHSSCALKNCQAKKAVGMPCLLSNQLVLTGQSCKRRSAQILQSTVSRRQGCLPSTLSSRIQYTPARTINSFGRYIGTSGDIGNPQKGGLVIKNF